MLIARIALCGMILLGVGTVARANYYDSPRELDCDGALHQAASGMVFP